MRKIAALLGALIAPFAFAQRPDVAWTNAATKATAISFSHDGTFFATTAVFETSIKIWRTSDHAFLRTIKLGVIGDPEKIAITADDKYVVVGCSGIQGDERPSLLMFRVSDGAFMRGFNPRSNNDDEWDVDTSPDNKMVAGAQLLSGTDIYNQQTGKLIRRINGATSCVRFSPDSQYVACATNSGPKIYRISDGTVVRSFPSGSGNLIEWSPDGTMLAIGVWLQTNASVSIYRVSDGAQVRVIAPNISSTVQGATGLRWSPDGTRIAVAGSHEADIWLTHNVSDAALDVWNVATGSLAWTYRYNYGTFFECEFTPNGQYLYTAGGKETVVYPDFDPAHHFDSILRFRVADGAQDGLANYRGPSTVVGFSPDSNIFVCTDANIGETLRASDGAHLNYFVGHPANITTVAVSPNGQFLATGAEGNHDYYGADGTIRIWDINTGAQLRQWVADGFGVGEILYTPDGNTIVETGGSGDIRFFNANTGAFLGKINESGDIALSPDGSLLAVTNSTGSQFKLFRMSDRGHVRTISDVWAVDSIAFSPDGATIAAAFEAPDHTLKLYRVSDGALLKSFNSLAYTYGPTVSFSPDGKNLIFADDHTIQIWDIATTQLLFSWDEELANSQLFHHLGVVVSPNQQYIGVGRLDSVLQIIPYPLPSWTPIHPGSFSPGRGQLDSGSIPQLVDSDDDYVVLKGLRSVDGRPEGACQMVVEGMAPAGTPTALKLNMEVRLTEAHVQQSTHLYNWTTARYDLVDTRMGDQNDNGATIVVANPAVYINPDSRRIRAMLGWSGTVGMSIPAWFVLLDRISWDMRR